MPRGNGMGPAGMGPGTGRGAGFCAGYGVPGYASSNRAGFGGLGRGYWNYPSFGMNSGLHRGSPFLGFTAEMGAEKEKEVLRNQALILERNLEELNKRLTALENSGKPETE